jgi:hypothetical protein
VGSVARSAPSVLEIATRGALDAVGAGAARLEHRNRALLIAALAAGERATGAALEERRHAGDGRVSTALGCAVAPGPRRWLVQGRGGKLQRSAAAIHARSSGTTARFLTPRRRWRTEPS